MLMSALWDQEHQDVNVNLTEVPVAFLGTDMVTPTQQKWEAMGTCAPSSQHGSYCAAVQRASSSSYSVCRLTAHRFRECHLPLIRHADWLTVASKDPWSTCKVNHRDHLTDFHGDPDTDLKQEDMQPGQAITHPGSSEAARQHLFYTHRS